MRVMIVVTGAALAALCSPAAGGDCFGGFPIEGALTPVPGPPLELGAPDSVPLEIEGDRARVKVKFGDYSIPMVIDTGATVMSVNDTISKSLIRRRLARDDGLANIAMADGSLRAMRRLLLFHFSVGRKDFYGVKAVVEPDEAEMLLPFGVIAVTGRFTIDIPAGLLTFGG